MKPCTSTNIHEKYLDKPYYFTLEESLYACNEAGFQAIDLNLHRASLSGGPLENDSTWRAWVEKIGLIRDELGVTFPSAHSYFYVWWPVQDLEQLTRHEVLVSRSIEAAGTLGVEHLVVHPYSVFDQAWYSQKKSIEYNLKFMEKYAKIACRYKNLHLAIENMVEGLDKRRFGSSAEDLLQLDYVLNDSIFGLCWDFGHGMRSHTNPIASLRQLGNRLKVVHVHDINEDSDHMLPFFGITQWVEIMPIMKEIGFEGYWNYECPNYTINLPLDLRAKALKFAYEVNTTMIDGDFALVAPLFREN